MVDENLTGIYGGFAMKISHGQPYHLYIGRTPGIDRLLGHFKSPKWKVLDQPDVKDTLHKLQTNYVLVPADKAANNVIIVCKKYYIDTLVKELGINNVNINNPTYIPIDDSFETIVKSHNKFITSVGLAMSEEDQNLPYLYWTPKLHKSLAPVSVRQKACHASLPKY